MDASLKDKEVLSQAEAWVIVGGRPMWTALKEAYPTLLKPIRTKGSKEQYFREVILTTLRAAQLDGKLREDVTKSCQ